MFILIFISNHISIISSLILTVSTIFFGLNKIYQRRVILEITPSTQTNVYYINNIGQKNIYDLSIKLDKIDIGKKPGIYPEKKANHYFIITEYSCIIENKPVDIDFTQHCNLMVGELKRIKLEYNTQSYQIPPEYFIISYIEKSAILRKKIARSKNIVIKLI